VSLTGKVRVKISLTGKARVKDRVIGKARVRVRLIGKGKRAGSSLAGKKPNAGRPGPHN
jgi:hypothetical protein